MMRRPFCRRIGREAFETDYHEWEDLTAHAQRYLGQERCSAADAVLTRIDTLARMAITKIRSRDQEGAAIAIGRALHTLQDECSHQGMTNEEHSFYSLTQTCEHADVSPDIQPAAIACADKRAHSRGVRRGGHRICGRELG
jgi:hypothetical protein